MSDEQLARIENKLDQFLSRLDTDVQALKMDVYVLKAQLGPMKTDVQLLMAGSDAEARSEVVRARLKALAKGEF